MEAMDRYEEMTNRLNNHSDRLKQLEISDARTGEKIQSLIEKIENLMTWIKALVMLGITSFVGFFFWYIQNIGR